MVFRSIHHNIYSMMHEVFDVPVGSETGRPPLHAVTLAVDHTRCPHDLQHSFVTISLNCIWLCQGGTPVSWPVSVIISAIESDSFGQLSSCSGQHWLALDTLVSSTEAIWGSSEYWGIFPILEWPSGGEDGEGNVLNELWDLFILNLQVQYLSGGLYFFLYKQPDCRFLYE